MVRIVAKQLWSSLISAWCRRPRTDQDIMTEAETKRAAEMEELKLREMTKKMQTVRRGCPERSVDR